MIAENGGQQARRPQLQRSKDSQDASGAINAAETAFHRATGRQPILFPNSTATATAIAKFKTFDCPHSTGFVEGESTCHPEAIVQNANSALTWGGRSRIMRRTSGTENVAMTDNSGPEYRYPASTPSSYRKLRHSKSMPVNGFRATNRHDKPFPTAGSHLRRRSVRSSESLSRLGSSRRSERSTPLSIFQDLGDLLNRTMQRSRSNTGCNPTTFNLKFDCNDGDMSKSRATPASLLKQGLSHETSKMNLLSRQGGNLAQPEFSAFHDKKDRQVLRVKAKYWLKGIKDGIRSSLSISASHHTTAQQRPHHLFHSSVEDNDEQSNQNLLSYSRLCEEGGPKIFVGERPTAPVNCATFETESTVHVNTSIPPPTTSWTSSGISSLNESGVSTRQNLPSTSKRERTPHKDLWSFESSSYEALDNTRSESEYLHNNAWGRSPTYLAMYSALRKELVKREPRFQTPRPAKVVTHDGRPDIKQLDCPRRAQSLLKEDCEIAPKFRLGRSDSTDGLFHAHKQTWAHPIKAARNVIPLSQMEPGPVEGGDFVGAAIPWASDRSIKERASSASLSERDDRSESMYSQSSVHSLYQEDESPELVESAPSIRPLLISPNQLSLRRPRRHASFDQVETNPFVQRKNSSQEGGQRSSGRQQGQSHQNRVVKSFKGPSSGFPYHQREEAQLYENDEFDRLAPESTVAVTFPSDVAFDRIGDTTETCQSLSQEISSGPSGSRGDRYHYTSPNRIQEVERPRDRHVNTQYQGQADSLRRQDRHNSFGTDRSPGLERPQCYGAMNRAEQSTGPTSKVSYVKQAGRALRHQAAREAKGLTNTPGLTRAPSQGQKLSVSSGSREGSPNGKENILLTAMSSSHLKATTWNAIEQGSARFEACHDGSVFL